MKWRSCADRCESCRRDIHWPALAAVESLLYWVGGGRRGTRRSVLASGAEVALSDALVAGCAEGQRRRSPTFRHSRSSLILLTAGGGDRTHTPFRARDFKSRASASSATPATPIVRLCSTNSFWNEFGLVPGRTHRQSQPSVPRRRTASPRTGCGCGTVTRCSPLWPGHRRQTAGGGATRGNRSRDIVRASRQTRRGRRRGPRRRAGHPRDVP